MARIRSVKPALRTSQVVARWPFEIRYFWVLLWGYLDDRGRGLDIPKTIAGDCFPHDDKVTAVVINRWLATMASTKVESTRDPPVCRYEVAGIRYLHSVYWTEHQRPNRPSPSQHPPCPVHESLTESLTEPSSEPDSDKDTERLSEGALSPHVLEFEGLTDGVRGMPAEPLTEPPTPSTADLAPPKTCKDHKDDPDPPACRRCATARERHETWQAQRRARLNGAPKCRTHRGQLADNCALCRSETLAKDTA